jgi:tetratricopeptide (TPR) repeat protein
MVVGAILVAIALSLLAAFVSTQRRRGTDHLSPEHWLEVGRKAIEAGDFKKALSACDSLLANPDAELAAHILRGEYLLATGKPELAVEPLLTAYRSTPEEDRVAEKFAEALYRAGRKLPLIQFLGDSPPDAPDAGTVAAAFPRRKSPSPGVDRWVAAALYDLGDNLTALRVLSRLAESSPNDAKPWRLIGLIHKDAQRFTEASVAYLKGLERNPPRLIEDEIILELAECYVGLRKYQELKDLLANRPSTPETILLQAQAAFGLGDVEQARKFLSQGLRAGQQSPGWHAFQGELELETGNVREALAALRKATAGDPSNFAAWKNLSQAERQLGNREQADLLQKRADAVREQMKRFSELHQQAEAEPRSIPVRMELATLAQELGKPELATVWYQSVLALDPRNTAARTGLENLSRRSRVTP